MNFLIFFILFQSAKNICYVSCDPLTLARDLKILQEKYQVIKVNALNMFPKTYHVETVCLMSKKEK